MRFSKDRKFLSYTFGKPKPKPKPLGRPVLYFGKQDFMEMFAKKSTFLTNFIVIDFRLQHKCY